MGELVASILITLDGYAAGPNGELDIFNVDQEFFDLTGKLTDKAGTAMYGRNTYQMMDSYWPTAAEQPDAGKHEKEHGAWYNSVDKVVVSRTMKEMDKPRTKIIGGDLATEIGQLKKESKKDIQIFGSPGLIASLMDQNLIDEYWIFVVPVVAGRGIPLFKGLKETMKLRLLSSAVLKSGAVALHYEKT